MNAKLKAIVDKAVAIRLDGREILDEIDGETIEREYNGIGPAFFPAKLRAKVTKWLGLFEPAALIHDLRNFRSDGMRWAFNYANYEFFANCRKCAAAEYPWWNWHRYRAYAVAECLYNFVSGAPGWKAWMDCFEKTQNKNRKENP